VAGTSFTPVLLTIAGGLALLLGVGPLDPIAFIVMPLTLAVAAAMASYVATHDADSVDPVETLRAE
jgi:hypothetical protein